PAPVDLRQGTAEPARDGDPRRKAQVVRLTVAQDVVAFLANQWTGRDGVKQPTIAGCFGIFGHGNVAGVGQALLQAQRTGSADLPYHLARNEQAMAHAAVGYARK